MRKIINTILIWVFVFNTSIISFQTEKYKSTEIITIPWGENSGQVGKKTELYNCIIAIPTNIEIDSERKRLYFSDHINRKIEAFNYSGQHVLSFPVQADPDIIKLDNYGNIYICIPGDDVLSENFSGSKIIGYDFTGKRLDIYNHPPQYLIKDTYPFIKMIYGTDIIATDGDKEWYIPIESTTASVKKNVTNCYYSCPVSNNYIYNIEIEPVDKTNDKTNDKRTYRYIITKRDMNNIVINRFRLCGGETSFRLLGVDKNDSVYIIQDYLKFNKFKIIITKYDASGNLTANFHLNEEYCQKGMEGTVYNVVDIDNEGLIFQMVNKENGLMVLKWEAVK